jgi:excinuclease ABC subunit A
MKKASGAGNGRAERRHFENIPQIHQKLKTLHDVGLDCIKSAAFADAFRRQARIKLARELVKKSTGRTGCVCR